MATAQQIAALRRMADEAGTDTYTDEALSAILDAETSLDGAAAVVWREKAAKASTLVNTTESGSSRSLQQVHTNALSMAKYYGDLSKADVLPVDPNAPFVVGIERA